MSDDADGSAERDHLISTRIDDLGLIRLTWLNSAQRITGPLAQHALRLIERLHAGQPRPLLVDVTGTILTHEARLHFATHLGYSRRARDHGFRGVGTGKGVPDLG